MYDANILHIEFGTLYTSGRYFTGLGKSFIAWSTTYQVTRFGDSFQDDELKNGGTITARSYDGLRVLLDISVQWKLSTNPDDLVRLYMDYSGDHVTQFGRILQQVAADVSSDYYAIEFFTEREAIQEDMRAAMNATLYPLYVRVQDLEVTNIDFYDSDYVTSVHQKQIATQDVLQAYAEQAVAQVQADTAVEVAQQTAITLLQTANQTALSYLASVAATADVLLYRIDRQAAALLQLKEYLGFNSTEDLLSYNYLTALLENTVGDVLVALPYPGTIERFMNLYST